LQANLSKVKGSWNADKQAFTDKLHKQEKDKIEELKGINAENHKQVTKLNT